MQVWNSDSSSNFHSKILKNKLRKNQANRNREPTSYDNAYYDADAGCNDPMSGPK